MKMLSYLIKVLIFSAILFSGSSLTYAEDKNEPTQYLVKAYQYFHEGDINKAIDILEKKKQSFLINKDYSSVYSLSSTLLEFYEYKKDRENITKLIDEITSITDEQGKRIVSLMLSPYLI